MTLSDTVRRQLARRLEPPVPPLEPSGKNASIQGLRGCAAIFVILLHLTQNFPDSGQWISNMAAGPGSVMLFFVISGYVIGLTTRHAWNADSRLAYWRRRLTRIAPLYLVGVAFTAIAAAYLQKPLPFTDVLAHVFFPAKQRRLRPFFPRAGLELRRLLESQL